MSCDLTHNPRRPTTDAEWLRASASKQSDPRARERFLAVARRLDLLLFRNLELEESLMDVTALCNAVTTKLKNTPTPPPADRVLTDANVQALSDMAAAAGVDTNGVPLPPLPAAQ